eukprot:scpid61404/ scgid19966/ NIPA-like protein 2
MMDTSESFKTTAMANASTDQPSVYDPHSLAADPAMAGMSHAEAVLIGSAVAVGGNLLISVSMNAQRFAHTSQQQQRDADGVEKSRSSYLCNWIWWVGLLLMVGGELGNFAAYSFAPASVVAPLGMTTVLANAAIAVVFLKETLHADDILGAFMAVIGAFLIINFSGKEEPSAGLSGHILIGYLKQPVLITYLSVELLAVALIWYIRETKNLKSVVLTLLMSSLIGSWTVIAAKAVAGLLRMTLRGHSQFGQPIFYIMIVILAVTAVLQVKFLNQAMIDNPATVVVPTNFVFFTVSAIIGGVVFYQEFRGLHMLEILMFTIGCCLCFAGVRFITLAHNAAPLQKSQSLSPYISAPPTLFGLAADENRFILIHGGSSSHDSSPSRGVPPDHK